MNDLVSSLPATPGEHDRHWAAGAHWGAMLAAILTSWCAGFAGMGVAIIVWLVFKDRSDFIGRHAAESFNFNLSIFIWMAALLILSILTLGIGLLVTVPIALVGILVWLVCGIKASIAALNGEMYRYPFTIRLLQ